jgi:hypothetical protein
MARAVLQLARVRQAQPLRRPAELEADQREEPREVFGDADQEVRREHGFGLVHGARWRRNEGRVAHRPHPILVHGHQAARKALSGIVSFYSSSSSSSSSSPSFCSSRRYQCAVVRSLAPHASSSLLVVARRGRVREVVVVREGREDVHVLVQAHLGLDGLVLRENVPRQVAEVGDAHRGRVHHHAAHLGFSLPDLVEVAYRRNEAVPRPPQHGDQFQRAVAGNRCYRR